MKVHAEDWFRLFLQLLALMDWLAVRAHYTVRTWRVQHHTRNTMASQIISRRLLLLRLGVGPSPQQQLLRRTSPAAAARQFSSPAPQPQQRCSISAAIPAAASATAPPGPTAETTRSQQIHGSLAGTLRSRRACYVLFLLLFTNLFSHDYTEIFLPLRTNCRKPRSASKTVGNSTTVVAAATIPPNGAPSCKPPRIP